MFPHKIRIKLKYIVPFVVFIVIAAVAICFIQLTSLGYRMTVSFRNFTKVDNGIFIHNKFSNDIEEAVSIIDEAKTRVKDYFGEINSTPVIIICDDKSTLSKLGGDHGTSTAVFLRAYSYIVLSSEYLNVDIAAHEMTHAEVHSRIFKGKVSNKSLIPIWFDEGVALQNDYRENYNEAAWANATDNGNKIIAFNTIETADRFYAGTPEERRYNFIISRHEVFRWVEENGKDSLIVLLDKVNQGDKFSDLY